MRCTKVALVIAVALMATAAGPMVPAAGQTIPSCASKLIDCANYLNATTTPPSTCCDPLNAAVKNELSCLCSVLNSTLVTLFNVNVTQALHVAKLCGSDIEPKTACAAASKSGNGTSTTPAASPPTSSSTSGSPATKSDNSAHGVTTIGFSGLLSLLLFSCWSLSV